MTLELLNIAKTKMLQGDLKMASAYYERARSEGIVSCVVDLRFVTKNYVVYPLEYEASSYYFELIKTLHKIAAANLEYHEEYILALESLLDIRRLFMRALSLYYYSDILVSASDSVILRGVHELQQYISENKQAILNDDIYEIQKYIPQYDRAKLERDLNVLEVYCMNILLSYTAEQHSVYQGKRYSATTVDYGYFYSTSIRSSDCYYNYANIKPRLFLLGYDAYYYDWLSVYEEKRRALGGFDSPKELRKELKLYVAHKDKSDRTAQEFNQYAKQFEKLDDARNSTYKTMSDLSKMINPMLRLNPMDKLMENNVGSFELKEIFPQRKLWGVCSMLAAGNGWKVDTVRYVMSIACCFAGLGGLAYVVLAVAKKAGYYFGVNVTKP